MFKRIHYNFAVAFIVLGLIVGCKSLTPVEATQSAGDETRTLISEHVADEARAKQLIELVDQLESDLMAYVEIQTAHNDALRRENADYNTTQAEIEAYIGKMIDAREEGQEQILVARFAMKNLMTKEEWNEVFSLKD